MICLPNLVLFVKMSVGTVRHKLSMDLMNFLLMFNHCLPMPPYRHKIKVGQLTERGRTPLPGGPNSLVTQETSKLLF